MLSRRKSSLGPCVGHLGLDEDLLELSGPPSLLLKDVTAGCQVLFSFAWASWWEWDRGSTLVFWRWHSHAPLARWTTPFSLSSPPLISTSGSHPSTRLQYLGNQDAARKRRPPTLTPGAWAGAVFKVGESFLRKTVTKEKWEKGKTYIIDLCRCCDLVDPTTELIRELTHCCYQNCSMLLSYKDLEVIRGFLVHLSMTFEI